MTLFDRKNQTPLDTGGKGRGVPGEGTWFIFSINYPVVHTHPIYHVLVVGGSGSGKTATILRPKCYEILVHRPQHLVMTDPKREELEAMKRAGAVQDYYLYSFEESSPSTSSINPIATPAMAEAFFNVLMHHPNAPDPFWGESAVDLATGTAEAIRHESLVTLYDVMRSPAKLDELAEDNEELNIAWAQQNQDHRESFRRHILTALRSLKHSHIRQLFAPGAQEPVFGPEEKVLAVLQTPLVDRQKRTWSPLISATSAHLWDASIAGYDRGGPGTYWPMDEAPVTLNLKELENWITTGRGKGQRLMPIFQDIGQIEEVLGSAGTRTLIGSCDLRIYGKTNERDSAERNARATGTHYVPRAVRQDAHRGRLARLINDMTGNTETRAHEVEETLVDPDEFMGFPVGTFVVMWGSKDNTEIVQGTPFEDYEKILASRNIHSPEQARQIGIAPESQIPEPAAPEADESGEDQGDPHSSFQNSGRMCGTCQSPVGAQDEFCRACGERVAGDG